MKNTNYIIALISGIIILVLDILTKYWAAVFTEHKIIIEKVLYFTYQKNTGIAFGISLPIWFQIIGSIIILIILFYISKDFIFLKKRQFLKPVLFGIIVGGAIGNLIGRITDGYVIDFIALKPFPIFNIADIGITLGLITLFFISIFYSKNT